MLPPSPRMVSFDWNDIVEPHLPSSTPFQIMVGVNKIGIHRCMVDEGSSASILSSLAWQDLGSPKLVSTTSELLDFDISIVTIEQLSFDNHHPVSTLPPPFVNSSEGSFTVTFSFSRQGLNN
jgi:hypothetical protein